MSGSIDPNVLNALAHPATVNLLQDYQGAAQAANSIWQNREWQARQAAGQAQQGGIDENGQYQPATALNLLRQAGPAAALAAPAALESSQRLSTAQTDQAPMLMKTIATALAPLAGHDANGNPAVPDDQMHGALNGVAERLRAAGVPAAAVNGVLSRLPPDAAGQRQQIELARQAILDPNSAQPAQLYGTRPAVDTGGGTAFPVLPPPSAGGPVPFVPHTLSPGEKVATQQTVAPDGTPGTVNVGSKYNPDGSLKPPGWGNGGKYAAPGTTAAAPVAPLGFTPTGQAPGQAESQRLAAEASTAAGTKIYKDADAATGMKSQLLTMDSDLAKISTGPVSERLAAANAFTHKLTGYGITMSADELASSEGFAKVAKQIALAQAGSLGAGTDEKLTTSLGANPNRDLSKMGNQQILAMLQGNADAIKARGVAYDQWKQTHPGADTNSFLTDFNKNFDPRVYQWGYQVKNMTPAQREAAYNALPDKTQFRQKYNAAVAQKLIDPNAY